ncbi:MAG TPA: hypothetical protein PLD30_12890 [Candidatus Competibacteraceae bacterium]|nr:hypothetical protein [Candidatus Competibacteraceae bacterium]
MRANPLESQNPVAVALQRAVLTTATAIDPEQLDFESEIDSRLLIIRSVVNLMAEATGAADGYGNELPMEGLHGLARLIGNELTVISILHESLQRVFNAEVKS